MFIILADFDFRGGGRGGGGCLCVSGVHFGGAAGEGGVCGGRGGGRKRRWMRATYSTWVLNADAQYFKDEL